jgi:SAM-dependent methyltransferase
MAHDPPALAPPPDESIGPTLPSEFVPASNDRYYVDDLLKYSGQEFIRNAYRAILKREPDYGGYAQYTKMLLEGRFDKVDVLVSLRYSEEGREKNVHIEGLAWLRMVRRAAHLPLIGYIIELASALGRLPSLLRHQRRFETSVSVEQQQLAEHLKLLSQRLQLVRTELAMLEKRTSAPSVEGGEHGPGDSAQGSPSRVLADEVRRNLDDLYASFEDQFRGSRDRVKEKLEVYLPLLREAGIKDDILDLGCGRGEWLELLKEEGLRARGIDLNSVMVERCRRRGLEATEAEAISYLRGLANDSLQAVTSFHLIEHLPFETLIMLIDEIHRALRPGGLLILETPNPKNLLVGACSFYSDPTHRNPIFPETIQFILGNRGFADVHLKYLNPVEGSSPFEGGDRASQALQDLFYGPRDFAVIGRKK